MQWTSADELLGLLRARQQELGLSNAALEQVCGLSGGQANRWLGPGREKSPTLASLCLILDGLGLSGTLHVDAEKEARVGPLWARAGRRAGEQVRTTTVRVSKIAIARAKSVVMSEAGRRAALARWKNTTKAERRAVNRFLLSHRARTKSQRQAAASKVLSTNG